MNRRLGPPATPGEMGVARDALAMADHPAATNPRVASEADHLSRLDAAS